MHKAIATMLVATMLVATMLVDIMRVGTAATARNTRRTDVARTIESQAVGPTN
ncbi:MAG TPA: hypothetical protein VGG64_12425 [Pirellulales bacterium]|jgi:hypothetical protein